MMNSNIRKIPSWIALAPWIIVALSLALAFAVILNDYKNREQETRLVTRIFMERGSTLIHACEAALQAAMGFRLTDEELHIVIDKIGAGPNIYYLAITDETGVVLAASDSTLIGKKLPGSETARPVINRIKGQIVEEGEKPVFQVFQILSVQQYGERLRKRKHKRPQKHDLIIFIGYGMQQLLNARQVDSRRTIINTSVLGLIIFVSFLALFLVKNYQRARNLAFNASAFSFALFDSLPSGLIAVDQYRNITAFNPAAERITGKKSADVVGAKLNIVFPCLYDAANRIENQHEMEIRCDFGNSHREALALSLIKLSFKVKKSLITTEVLILRDLGEIRKLQTELRRQERLAALGHMAAGVAHEIRNPLGTIKGLARFFLEISPKDSEEAKAAAIMTRETQRLDNVVGDLLELSRPDRLEIKETSIPALLDRVEALMRAEMDKGGIKYLRHIPETLPKAMIDENRMTQVLINLFLNAIQAMPNGGCLTVEANSEDSPSGKPIITLTVKDTGEGIPQDKLQQIFSPYYTTRARGTGLGLPLTQKIVEAHNGEIEVISEPGKGTSFIIHLPAARPAKFSKSGEN